MGGINVTSVSRFVKILHEQVPRVNFSLDPVSPSFDLSNQEYISSLEFWAIPATGTTIFFIIFALCYLCSKINTPDPDVTLFRILTKEREKKVRTLTKWYLLVIAFFNTALSGFTLVASIYEYAAADALQTQSEDYVFATRTSSISVLKDFVAVYNSSTTVVNATTIDTAILELVLASRRSQNAFDIFQVVHFAKMIITIIVSLSSIAVATTIVITTLLEKAVFLRISTLYTLAIIILYAMSFSTNFVLSLLEADFCYALTKVAEGSVADRLYVDPFIACLDSEPLSELFTDVTQSIQNNLAAIYNSEGALAPRYLREIAALQDIQEQFRHFVDCTNGEPAFVDGLLRTICVSNVDVSVASWICYVIATVLAVLQLIGLMMGRPFFVRKKKFISADRLQDVRRIPSRPPTAHYDSATIRDKRNSSLFRRSFLTKARSVSFEASDLEEPLVSDD